MGEGVVRDPPPGGSGEWSGTPFPSWHLGGKIFGAAEIFSPFGPQRRIFWGSQIFAIEKRGGSRPLPSDPGGSGPSSTLCTFFRSHNALLEGLRTSTHSFPGPWGSAGISRGLFLPHRIFSYPLASFWYPWRSSGLPGLFWETWESFVPREGICICI